MTRDNLKLAIREAVGGAVLVLAGFGLVVLVAVLMHGDDDEVAEPQRGTNSAPVYAWDSDEERDTIGPVNGRWTTRHWRTIYLQDDDGTPVQVTHSNGVWGLVR